MSSNLSALPGTPAAETTNPPPKKHGGGPKTPQGKARSSMNALKHGCYAVKFPVLKTESVEAYQQHLSIYYARFAPVDQTEKELVADLAHIQWSLNRVAVWEAQTIDSQIDALHNSPFSPGADGQAERTVVAVHRALEKPALAFFTRRQAALIRARTATLKAIADIRRNHPSQDPSPGFLPDPLHYPGDLPEPAPEPQPQAPPPPPEPSPILLPPYPHTLLDNLKKRTPVGPPPALHPTPRRTPIR